jgi:hypothetical protein
MAARRACRNSGRKFQLLASWFAPEFSGSGGAAGGPARPRLHGGRNVIIVWQWAENVEQLPRLATELVAIPVDVIFAPSSTFVDTARKATSTIPIVFAVHADPVGLGRQVSRSRMETSQGCRCCSPSSALKDWR